MLSNCILILIDIVVMPAGVILVLASFVVVVADEIFLLAALPSSLFELESLLAPALDSFFVPFPLLLVEVCEVFLLH